MNAPVLDVRQLSVQFLTPTQPLWAVKDLAFTLMPGQTLGIVGESGSGKSVTALAILGLVPPPGRIQGEIWFCGRQMQQPVDLRQLSERSLIQYRGGQIAMIFQEPQSALNPVFTIGFQIMEVLRQHGRFTPAQAQTQALALLEEVQLLPGDEQLRSQIRATAPGQTLSDRQIQDQIQQRQQALLNRYPHQLSGGQMQRVMIAMAIATEPDILIADEPTTALDVTVQASILRLLRELQQRRQMAMIFITHDLGLITELADTVAVMYRGEVVEKGAIANVFAKPQHPYTQGLLTCRPPSHQRVAYLPTIADFMDAAGDSALPTPPNSLGHETEPARFNLPIDPATLAARLETLQNQSPLLVVENLRVQFPVKGSWGIAQRWVAAVDDVSFAIYPGETLGLVGESGCGKTTLARTLMRLYAPSQGQITFEGRSVNTLKGLSLQQFRRDVQLIFQDPFSALDPRMTIGAAILEPMQIHSRRSQKNYQRNCERVAYLLERVGLSPDWMHRFPHEFSGGQRQRVCIARALALNPKLVICDESVSALDVSVQAQVLNLLKELQQDFALTYLFISHDLSVVRFMSDRIMVMNQGKVEEIGPAEQIYLNPQQPYTQDLIAAIPTRKLDSLLQRQANE